MNLEIKKRWVEALRSGKYKRGKGRLRRQEDTYCCLGVLCDLAREDGLGHWAFSPMTDTMFKLADGFIAITLLPKSVVEWAGLHEHDPTISPVTTKDMHIGLLPTLTQDATTLSMLNDFTDLPFSTIAGVIERDL